MIGPHLIDLAEALVTVGVTWLDARRQWLAPPPAPEPPALRITPLVRLSSEEFPMPRTVFRVDADLRPVPPGLPPGRVARQFLRLVVDGKDFDRIEVPLGTPTFEVPVRFEVREQLTIFARYQSAAGVDGPEAEARLEPFAEPDGGGGGDTADPTPPPAHPGLTLRVIPEQAEDEDEADVADAGGDAGADAGGAGAGAGGAGAGAGPVAP